MLLAICLRRRLSLYSEIFLDTPTLLSKGSNTQNLPGKETEEVTRTPLLFTGSFVIWIKISCPLCSFGITLWAEISFRVSLLGVFEVSSFNAKSSSSSSSISESSPNIS